MKTIGITERVYTVIIGGGQAGLSVGYHLARHRIPFVILDAGERIGDAWRNRWDSLRLFTPAAFDGLDGMPFPGSGLGFPTKDEMADYLEAYAARFALPVRCGVRVDRVYSEGGRYVVAAGTRCFEADRVVVAMANFQQARVPAYAKELDAGLVQLHSSEYRTVAQLRDGDVLVVGAGNSGAEIAHEMARLGRGTWLSGRDVGEIPWRTDSFVARAILSRIIFRIVFHRILSTSTPMGRRLHAKGSAHSTPLIRVKRRQLAALGVGFVPRVVGVRTGMPLFDDGRVLPVRNVIWCTGFEPGFSWLDLPVFDARGEVMHERGIVARQPGLYFVGLHFLHAMSSAMLHGVGRDAAHVAAAIARSYPPAIAPMTRKGSLPRATASGSTVSGASSERSSSHA